jgi:hypothetical protein
MSLKDMSKTFDENNMDMNFVHPALRSDFLMAIYPSIFNTWNDFYSVWSNAR